MYSSFFNISVKSSIEINELNDKVLKIFEESDILVPHLHVPLQSGSEEILRLMNRKYNKDFFEQKIVSYYYVCFYII